MKSKKEVVNFYDQFKNDQVITGINQRHHEIMERLLRFDIDSAKNILEIGCGIGTLTELMARSLKGVDILAVDISPESIELGQKRLEQFSSVKLEAMDIITADIKGSFDAIVLPDVIEHIPVDLHTKLFEKVAALLTPGGHVLISVPNPFYLKWVAENQPEKLQIIDQPIHTATLVANTEPHGLYIHYMEYYGIWTQPEDMVFVVLKKVSVQDNYELKVNTPTIQERIKHKIKRTLGQ